MPRVLGTLITAKFVVPPYPIGTPQAFGVPKDFEAARDHAQESLTHFHPR